MHNKVKTLKVTAWNPTTATITKANSHGRLCFALEGEYTLEDGSKLNHPVTSERKKNLAKAIQMEQSMAAQGAVTAEQWSDGNKAGDYWMFCTRFTIGSSGLQPFAGHKDSGIPAKPSEDGQASAGLFGLEEPHASEATRLLSAAGCNG